MKEIFLIRHGRQNSKRCNVDVELAPEGREQARAAGKRLQTYGIEKLYHSDLVRARQTAQIINEFLQVPCEELTGIQEIDFGGLTGKTEEEIRSEFSDFQKERSLHRSDLRYPGDGECGEDVVRRAMPKIRSLCEKKEDRIAVVTHGGVIRSLCAFVLESNQKNKLKFGIDLENASFTELLYDENRELFFLERFNDFAHLEGHPELLRSGWITSLERQTS